MKGIIKFFKEEKGYGFITMEDDTDIFFHISDFINLHKFESITKDLEV